jgi:outer membrane protein OmpA-like peptidoglycan-associated protein
MDWLPVSDVMSGLMMVFLFISVVIMRSAITTQATIEEVTVSHQLLREELYRGLLDEFEEDLDNWHASVHQENLTMSFHESDGMFASGQSTLNAHYMTIFGEFYPRYINVIEPYVGSILEIRIEGHTSKGWQNSESELEAYLNNLGLSQNRALSVLKLLSNVDSRSSSNSMLFSKFTSIGYSSAKPLLDERGLEDIEGSRRVAFRIILPELTDTVQLLNPSFN